MRSARWMLLVLSGALPMQGAEGPLPLSPEEALKSFQLADPALRVELVAAEPLVASPCAVAWDEKGRLFVAENRGYPSTVQPPQGVVALLEDTDGDGRMDQRTVFAEGLTFPNGVLPWQGGVIVTCAPDVLFLKDTDGDGRADVRQVLLTGFDTKGSTQLRVNAPTLGPDGWIYLAAGLSGGTITAPGHPDLPALKMTGDVRFNPTTLVVENVDGRSQYGMSFDEYGRRFICMNRVPVQHVVLSSRWLRRNPNLAFSDTVQDCNERSVRTGLHGGGDGVRLFPLSSNITTADSHAGSFSAACGIHIWGGRGLPESYRGGAFSCDPTGNLIHADKLAAHGATFSAEPMFAGKEFLASRDDWFRPVYLADGPDGALYVADMYRRIIEHPDYLPEEVRKRTDFEGGKEKGRIWRIRPNVRPPSNSVPLLEHATVADLITALRTDQAWLHGTAQRLLTEREPKEVKAVLQATANSDDLSARTWVLLLPSLARYGLLEPGHLQRAWDAGDAALRALVLRIWLQDPAAREWKPDPAVLAHDSDPEVRFVDALALGEIPEGTAALADLAAEEAREENPAPPLDRWTRAAVFSGVAGREKEFLGEFMEQAQTVTPGSIEDFILLGREFRDVPSLRAGLEVVEKSHGLESGRAGIAPTLMALLLGVSERSNQPLKLPDPPDRWLTLALTAVGAGAEDRNEKPERRLLYIRVLGRMEWILAGPPLKRLANDEPEESLRLAAIRAISGFADPDVAGTLLGTGKWASYTPVLRESVLSALLGNPAHASGILEAIESGRLPASVISPVRRRVFLNSKDTSIRGRAEKFWSAPSADRQKTLDAAKPALALQADPQKGRLVFKNVCSTCHRLDREGFALGPDLLDMRNQTKESILFHIVAPDAEVNVAYAPYLAETKDGRTLAGILGSETPASITLRMPLGVEETLLRANLSKLEALPGSLMPAGLEQGMSRQELADLLGCLKGE